MGDFGLWVAQEEAHKFHTCVATCADDGGNADQPCEENKTRNQAASAVTQLTVFFSRLWKLLLRLHLAPALLLVVISLGEAYIVSRVGGVTARFYSVFVDRRKDELAAVLGLSAALYVASSVLSATQVGVMG